MAEILKEFLVSTAIKATNYGYISQAAPTTIFTGVAPQANIVGKGSYDGVSLTRRAIFEFKNGVAYNPPNGYILNCTCTTNLIYGYNGGASFAVDITATVRARLITSKFLMSALTWNSFAALTLGTSTTNKLYEIIIPNLNGSGGPYTSQYQTAVDFALAISSQSNEVIYGIVVDSTITSADTQGVNYNTSMLFGTKISLVKW